MIHVWDPYKPIRRAPYSERNLPPRRGLIQRCERCGRAWNVSRTRTVYICMECERVL